MMRESGKLEEINDSITQVERGEIEGRIVFNGHIAEPACHTDQLIGISR